LGRIIQHNFDLLFPCGLAHMVEVQVYYTQFLL
jgi:hypothetical protein